MIKASYCHLRCTLALLLLTTMVSVAVPAGEPERVYITRFEKPKTYKRWYGRRGDKGGGAKAIVETKEVQSGKNSMRLKYSFPGTKTKGVFSRLRVVPINSPGMKLMGEPESFKIWIYGDNSGHAVKYRIYDQAGRTWIKSLCTLDFEGWKQIESAFNPGGWNWGGKKGAPKDKFVYPLQFAEFSVVPKDDKPYESSIIFDDFEIYTKMDAKSALTLTLECKERRNLTTGTSIDVLSEMKNLSTTMEINLNVVTELRRLDNQLVYTNQESKVLAPGQDLASKIAVPLKERGYYDFITKICDENGVTLREGKLSVGRVAPQGAADVKGGYFGACIHGTGSVLALTDLRQLGGTVIRGAVQASWGRYGKEDGSAPDFTKMDKQVEWMREAGLGSMVVLGGNPKWLKLEKGQGTDVEGFCNHVRQVARHLKGKVRYYDIWNEPDLSSWKGTPAQFGQMAKQVYKVIKEEDPDAQPIFASTSGVDFHSVLRNFTFPAVAGIDNEFPFDALNVHPYCRPKSPGELGVRKKFLQIKKWMTDHGHDKPLTLGEIGWPTSTDNMGVSEELQAAYLAQIAIIGLSVDAEAFIWYKPTSSRDQKWSEMQYGYYRHKGDPKPSAFAFSQAAYRLKKAKFVKELGVSGKLRCYLFSTPSSSVAILYALHGVAGAELKLAEPDGIQAEAFDGFPVDITKKIPLSDLPHYFVTSASAQDTLIKALENASLIGIDEVLDVNGYIGSSYKLTVKNMTNKNQVCAAEIKDDTGAILEKSNTRVPLNLKSLQSQVLSLPLASLEKSARGKINVVVGDKTYASNVWAIPFARLSSEKLGQSFQLYNGETISLSRADIMPADMQHAWKGNDNLSASLQWGWSKRGIHLLMDVKDDKHVPEDKTKSLWRGDSIQVAIDLSQNGPSEANTVELGFHVNKKGKAGMYSYTGEQPKDDAVEYAVSRDNKSGKTHYEVVIGWDFLGGFKPKTGKVIYMSAMINENDGAGRKSVMGTSEGIGGEHLPHLFPALIMK